METFTPSLNWGDELITSLAWVAKAWAIAAVCTLVVLALLVTVSQMGPAVLAHHRRLLHGSPKHSGVGALGVLLASVMIDVRLGVLFSYQSNDQFSAMQAAFGGEGAAKKLRSGLLGGDVVLVGLAVTDIVRNLLDVYLMQRFIIRWRVW